MYNIGTPFCQSHPELPEHPKTSDKPPDGVLKNTKASEVKLEAGGPED